LAIILIWLRPYDDDDDKDGDAMEIIIFREGTECMYVQEEEEL
jgi:isocitrate/isopropylmalate dehydrogenase